MRNVILVGDVREKLREIPTESVHCVVTSPPYWGLRDYGTDGQLGLEATPEEYVANMVDVFREVKRVMRKDGTLWLNLGSSYASGETSPNRSLGSQRAPSYDNGDKELPSSPQIGSSYRGLCDECRGAIANRIENKSQRLSDASLIPVQRDRDSERQDSWPTSVDAVPRVVQASTTIESGPQLLDECFHCSNCDACLNVLASASRDSRLCVRRTVRIDDNAGRESADRNQGKDALGMAWLNYTSTLKPKDMVPIPWMVAMALQQDGWWLRSDIIWSKPNPMPESVTDRPTKAHEYLFLLTKSQTYYYDSEAIREAFSPSTIQRVNQPNFDNQHGGAKDYGPDSNRSARKSLENLKQNMVGKRQYDGFNDRWDDAEADATIPSGRNRRTVWEIATEPYADAHFATFPQALVKPCILAGTSEHGCCSVCGAPWVRVVERSSYDRIDTDPKKLAAAPFMESKGSGGNVGMIGSGKEWQAFKDANPNRFLGWAPTCKHEAPLEPALVLDPFMGSGTVGAVAKVAGRDYIGTELNPAYAEMAKRRIGDQGRLL